MEIGARTRLLAILGDPVEHSLSPAMHNAAVRVLGLDAVYVALHCPPAALPALLGALAAVNAAGNITVPHKEAAERCLARKTDVCARVGACNTFWTEQGALVGDNTDVAGILAALEQLGAGGADRWLVIGTGGSARAVAVAAAERQAALEIVSRDRRRAAEFCEWARSRGTHAEPARPDVTVDLAINTTPLGLKPADPLPFDVHGNGGAPARLPFRAALDLVYAPGETRWVKALRTVGVTAQDGREMLLQQGIHAFSRFFPDARPPVEVMRAALARALRD